MIVDKEVEVCITGGNIKHLKSMGYDIKVYDYTN